jgi:hypothetical protein
MIAIATPLIKNNTPRTFKIIEGKMAIYIEAMNIIAPPPYIIA